MPFAIGQRWSSHSDKSLGLGIVTEIDFRRITLEYPAVGETRTYATDTAPLSRIRYRENDQVTDEREHQYIVQSVEEHMGLITYHCVDRQDQTVALPECELNSYVQFTTPMQRLFNGQFSRLEAHRLRIETLTHLHRLQRSQVNGLLGARTSLLAHQIYIANEVASRHSPRVLLADEVGLGKTIEAGLIMHHQVQRAQAVRILILVPEPLLHQWLVEMLRRFNLSFAIFDHERIQAQLESDDSNPFDSEQRILCSINEVCGDSDTLSLAMSTHWDMLVVDEAHHLHWSQDSSSQEYDAVEQLAQVSDSVLLLTATPEQLGIDSHFARLRLLDPARFHDLKVFKQEQENFQAINVLVSELQDSNQSLSTSVLARLSEYLGEQVVADSDRGHLIRALTDRHGTGRVLFRNTRSTVSGFPQRELHATALPEPSIYLDIKPTEKGYFPEHDIDDTQWIKDDPRVEWLRALIKSQYPDKIIVICHYASTAIALEKYFNLRAGIRATSFHEELSILERDRAAAWFADDDSGAQVMLCSEIGSEGRNFQFAHHLVLYDLPLNPDLVEQRIGRLDRIGQRQTIQIHLPYLQNSPNEVLFRWYHEGLNIFQLSCPAGDAIYTKFAARLQQQMHTTTNQLQSLIDETHQFNLSTRTRLEQGRDRLLEINSCDPFKAQDIINAIEDEERSQQLRNYMQAVFDHYGVDYEEHSEHSQILKPSGHMRTEHFPGLSDEGVSVTYDRDKALAREDLEFLCWEHPMVSEVMEMILKSDTGNATIASMQLKALKPGTLLVEATFTIECLAPPKLQLQRYLPLHPHRVLLDIRGNDYSNIIPASTLDKLCQPIAPSIAQALVKEIIGPVEKLMTQAHGLVDALLTKVRTDAQEQLQQEVSEELERLQALKKINPGIRDSELTFLEEKLKDSKALIQRSEFQLQALRLIINNQD